MGKELAQERKVDGSVKKLLFLGSGGSGKSTLFKQLRSLHGAGFGDKDRLQFKEHIYAQITEQMRLVIECIEVWNEDAEEKTLELTAAGEEAKAKLMGHANATQVSIHSLSLSIYPYIAYSQWEGITHPLYAIPTTPFVFLRDDVRGVYVHSVQCRHGRSDQDIVGGDCGEANL